MQGQECAFSCEQLKWHMQRVIEGPSQCCFARAAPTGRPPRSRLCAPHRALQCAGRERPGEEARLVVPRLEDGPAGVQQRQLGVEVGPRLQAGRAVVSIDQLQCDREARAPAVPADIGRGFARTRAALCLRLAASMDSACNPPPLCGSKVPALLCGSKVPARCMWHALAPFSRLHTDTDRPAPVRLDREHVHVAAERDHARERPAEREWLRAGRRVAGVVRGERAAAGDDGNVVLLIGGAVVPGLCRLIGTLCSKP